MSAGPPIPKVVWAAIGSEYFILSASILIFWAICHRFFIAAVIIDDSAA